MNNTPVIPESIAALIIDFFQGILQEEGMEILQKWLNESDDHPEMLNQLKTAWIMSGKPVKVSSDRIELQLERIKAEEVVTEEIRRKAFWNIGKIAASWILMLAVGGGLGGYIFKGSRVGNQVTTTTIKAPLGSKSYVDLPDGTGVWINAGSQISYNSQYGQHLREIQLIGEAYFSVKSNKEIPFIVRTSEIQVKALGTKFNVKAYPEEGTITTTLEEGKVIVSSLHAFFKRKAELKPREMVTFYKEKVTVSQVMKKNQDIADSGDKKTGEMSEIVPEVKTELITSWKDSTWIIERQPLTELLPLLERRYNVVISYEKEIIKKLKFTGKIKNETIEQIMMALELSAPIRFQINNNHINLTVNTALLKKYSDNTNY